MCTAADVSLAARVATFLGLFDGVIASNRGVNVAGAAKASLLVQRFGEGGFDYCGNEPRDILVWKHARGAIVVRGGERLERKVAEQMRVLRTFPAQRNTLKAMVRALRPHQWVKNILVLVPFAAAHRIGAGSSIFAALMAVVSFCLCASSVYVLNDLLDLEADRAHHRKSKRPFAAGQVSILVGLILAPALLVGAAIIVAVFLSAKFALVLGTYYVLTLAYSFRLKGVVLVDALTLAGLYTLRVIAGAAAVDVPLSFWLLLFSVFLFLSLAFVKRFA